MKEPIINNERSSTNFLVILLILIIIVGGAYFLYQKKRVLNESNPIINEQGEEVSALQQVVEGIVLATGGIQTYPLVGENAAGVQYKTTQGSQEDLIKNIENTLLAQGWLIRSSGSINLQGTGDTELYLISALEPQSTTNLQVNISSQGINAHSVTIVYSE